MLAKLLLSKRNVHLLLEYVNQYFQYFQQYFQEGVCVEGFTFNLKPSKYSNSL